MEDNRAMENGGAFYLTGGTLAFDIPDMLTASDNYIYGDDTVVDGAVRTLDGLLF